MITAQSVPCLEGLSLSSESRELFLRAYSEALHVLDAREASATGELDEARNACLLFVARTLSLNSEGASEGNGALPLSRIVSTSASNLFDFFRELPIVLGALGSFLTARGSSSRELEAATHISEWRGTLVYLTLLTKKYKDLFNQLLHQLVQYKQVVLRLGWMLFVVLKMRLLPSFPDLVSCMELLACTMTVLVSKSPVPSDLLPADGTRRAPLDTLARVAGAINQGLDTGRIQLLMASVDVVVGELMARCCGDSAATHKSIDETTTGQASACDGLLGDVEKMTRCVAALEEEYESFYSRRGEIDERELLTMDFHSFMSPRFSPALATAAAADAVSRPSEAGGAAFGMSTSGTLLSAAAVPPGMHSPMPSMDLMVTKQTPISEAIDCTLWLKRLTINMPDGPPPSVQRLFERCKPNPGNIIARRALEMAAAALPDDQPLLMPFPLLKPSLAKERRAEACKLYYHALEAVLTAEERTNSGTNCSSSGCGAGTGGGGGCSTGFPSSLLTSARFHRGLMACSAETVVATYRMSSAAFPKVLTGLKLPAFELSKMIASFVRHVGGGMMPHDLKRHMFMVEEKIIEAVAWEPGSSLYPLIVCTSGPPAASSNGEPAAVAAAAVLAAAATGTAGAAAASVATHDADPPTVRPSPPATAPLPSPSKRSQQAAFNGMVSPIKRLRGDSEAPASSAQPLPSAVVVRQQPAQFSDPLPSAVGLPPAASALHLDSATSVLHEFLRKVLKLSSHRIAALCNCFDFAPVDRSLVAHKVYEVVRHALYLHTHLFYNRHLDQVLLSALYGYCKVRKLGQITFRDIITQYRKQPQHAHATYRSVVLEQTNPGLQAQSHGDIIAFYNQAFVPVMKPALIRIAEADMAKPVGPVGGTAAACAAPGAGLASPLRATAQRPPLHPMQQHLSPSAKRRASADIDRAQAAPVAATAVAPSAPAAPLPAAARTLLPVQGGGGGLASFKMPGGGGGGRLKDASGVRRVPSGLATLLRALEVQTPTSGSADSAAGGPAPSMFQFGTITSAQLAQAGGPAAAAGLWTPSAALPNTGSSNSLFSAHSSSLMPAPHASPPVAGALASAIPALSSNQVLHLTVPSLASAAQPSTLPSSAIRQPSCQPSRQPPHQPLHPAPPQLQLPGGGGAGAPGMLSPHQASEASPAAAPSAASDVAEARGEALSLSEPSSVDREVEGTPSSVQRDADGTSHQQDANETLSVERDADGALSVDREEDDTLAEAECTVSPKLAKTDALCVASVPAVGTAALEAPGAAPVLVSGWCAST